MTNLIPTPAGFGYPPAREARLESQRALERGLTAACSLLGALFGLAFLLRGLVPAAQVPVPVPPPPWSPGTFVIERPAERLPGIAPPTNARGGMPLPVPDAVVEPTESTTLPVPGAAGAAEQGVPATGGETGGSFAPDDGAIPGPEVFRYVEQLPEVAVRVYPQYPEFARQAGVEGTVVVWALVDRDGSVREVRVQKSVLLLDAAAVEAVARWRFTPALDNGRPVRAWVSVPVRFSLR